MSDKKSANDEFPVDVRPLVRAGTLLLVVFGGLCSVSYFQEGAEMYRIGILFFCFVIGVFAYTQRDDSFRMFSILGAGLLIALALFFLGGDESEAPKSVETKPKRSLNESLPEGMGE